MTDEQGPLVSVITPVYNSEEFVGQCLESVLAQTYDSFEYIVMENCSTDATLEIARRYAARDSRIRLLQGADFVGADANANRALREISPQSRYTKIVHADDWLFPECLQRMVEVGVANPSVGIVGAYRLEGQRVSLNGLPDDITVLSGRDFCRSQLLGGPWGYLIGSPSSVLYRSDLVRSRPEFYPLDNPFQSDQEVCYLLLQENDFGFVHDVLTYTRRHEGADSAFYDRVLAADPGQLSLLVKYGPVYLSEAELQRRLAARTVGYLGMLARNLGKLRSREYRQFQGESLSELRRTVRTRDVARGLVRALEAKLS